MAEGNPCGVPGAWGPSTFFTPAKEDGGTPPVLGATPSNEVVRGVTMAVLEEATRPVRAVDASERMDADARAAAALEGKNRKVIEASYSTPEDKDRRELNRRKVRFDCLFGPTADAARSDCRAVVQGYGVEKVSVAKNRHVGPAFFDCYVTFRTEEEAREVIEALHAQVIQRGCFPVKLMLAWDRRRAPPTPARATAPPAAAGSGRRISLSPLWGEDAFAVSATAAKLLRGHGDVTGLRVRAAGHNVYSVVAEFRERISAIRAIAVLHGSVAQSFADGSGTTIEVDFAK